MNVPTYATATHRARAGWRTLALAALLLLGTGAARAQNQTLRLPRGLALKAGAFFTNNSNLSNEAGNTWWALGLEMAPDFRYHPLGGTVHLNIDGAFRSSSAGDYHSISIGPRLLWPLAPPSQPTHLWGGIEPAVYLVQTANLSGFATIGVKFIAGVDLNLHWFLEANYDYVSGFTDNAGVGLRVDGTTVAVGYRF